MSVFEYERDAIRVKARLRNANDDGESVRKFSVDPNLTSYETLRNLLSRAFDLCGEPASADFRLIYQFNNDQWLPLLSDWDLDAAIISASDPILVIEVNNTPYKRSFLICEQYALLSWRRDFCCRWLLSS